MFYDLLDVERIVPLIGSEEEKKNLPIGEIFFGEFHAENYFLQTEKCMNIITDPALV